MIDEVTGLETADEKLPPSFLVTNGRGMAYAIFSSRAAARAWIRWFAPTPELIVEEI